MLCLNNRMMYMNPGDNVLSRTFLFAGRLYMVEGLVPCFVVLATDTAPLHPALLLLFSQACMTKPRKRSPVAVTPLQ